MAGLTFRSVTARRWVDLEGHPMDETRRTITAMEAYSGVTSMVAEVGFTEVDRRGVRPLHRLTLDG